MELCWPRTLFLVISYVFLIGVCCTALDVCRKIDDCSCELLDGKQINIRSLGYEGSQAPRFPYVTAGPGSWRYAFNPCYAWTDTTVCQNVVACQEEDSDPATLKFAIGSASPATWKQENNKYVVEYSSIESGNIRTSVVTLACDQTKVEPTLIRFGSRVDPQFPTTTFYDFTLTSKCCCPGACNSNSPAGGDTGISPGSVLCIIVSVLIIVYIVGGVIFMKFVRHAEGTELIPNRDIWTGLFGSIRDGCVFIFSCGKKSGYDTMK